MNGEAPVRLAIVGCGNVFGYGYLPVVPYLENAKAVCVVDKDENRARDAGKKLGCDFTASIEEGVGRDDVDGVVILSPVMAHRDHAVACARAGKHILLEKPMARTVAECDEIIQACADAGVRLQLGFNRRFDPGFQKIKEFLASGEIGEPYYVHIRWLEYSPREGEQLGWREQKAAGGGFFQDHGSHYIDLVRWWLDQEVESVSGMCKTVFEPREVEDFAVACLRFPRAYAVIETGTAPIPYADEWREIGTIVAKEEAINFRTPKLFAHTNEPVEIILSRKHQTEDLSVGRGWTLDEQTRSFHFYRQLEHFGEVVAGRAEPWPTGADGRAAIEAICALYQASEKKTEIPLPLRRR